MLTNEQKNKLPKIIEELLEHTRYFISRNNLASAIQHMNVILISANKGHLARKDVQSIITFLMQQEISPSFYGSLLLDNKSDEAYKLFEKAVEVANKYKLDDEALALQAEIGSLLTEGISVKGTSSISEDQQPQYRSAFNNLHAVLRGRHAQGATLDILIPTIYNINNLEARYYYSILKEFIVYTLKRLTSKKANAIFDITPFFNTINFVGQRLIVNDLTTKAWDLYDVTQIFMPDEHDVMYLESFCTIGANIIQKPELPELPPENKFTKNYPTLADYLEKVPVRAEWQKYVVKLANMRKRFLRIASTELMESNVDNILEVQKLFSEDIKDLVSEMMTDTTQIIGLPPEVIDGQRIRFCLLTLGSMANQTPTPYSDLEFAFLLQDVPGLTLTKQRDIKEYFDRLLRLFEFMMASLGEYSPAGLHFDKEGHPLHESRLYGTAQQLIAATQPPIAPTMIDPLSYSLYHAHHLFGDHQLLYQYSQYRRSCLTSLTPNQDDSIHRLIARGFLNLHIEEFDNFSLRPGHRFDIKKPMYTFLNYIILDLALYYNIASTDYDFTFCDALEKLESLCKLSTKFSNLCQNAMRVIQVNRVRAQMANKQQLELFYYPKPTEQLKKQKRELNYIESSFTDIAIEYNTLLVEFTYAEKYCDQLDEHQEISESILSALTNASTVPVKINGIREKSNNIRNVIENDKLRNNTTMSRHTKYQGYREKILAEHKNNFELSWHNYVHAKELISKAIEQVKQHHQYDIQISDEMFDLLSHLISLLSTPNKISENEEKVHQLETCLKENFHDLKDWSLTIRLTYKQFQQINSVYQGVLLPLFWAAKYLYEHGEWMADPAIGMFAKSIEQYHDEENPISPKDLRANIKSFAYYLALWKADPIDYYRYLSRLEESLYDYYFRVVEEAETSVNNDLLRLNRILSLLRYYPYENGRRKQIELNAILWFDNLKKLLLARAPDSRLSVFVQCVTPQGENSSKIEGYLNNEMLSKIPIEFLNGDGQKICSISHSGKRFYLKKDVQAPAIEYAANLYSAFLIGHDSVHSELMRWTVKDRDKNTDNSYAVTIVDGGNNDLTPIREEPEYYNLHYDPKAYSLAFLLELLLTPDDRSTDNYCFRELDDCESKKRVPVSLFNEFAFSNPGNIRSLPDGSERFFLMMNSILLIQPELFLSVHPDARDEFLRLDAGRLLCEILLLLTTQYRSYIEIFGKQDGKDILRWISGNQKSSQTYFMFPGFITHQYNTIVLIQHLLRAQPEISHLQLLQHILPTVAYYNELVRSKKLPNSLDDFKRLAHGGFVYNIAGIVSYSEERKNSLVKSPSHENLSIFSDGSDNNSYIKPREALAELSFLQKDGKIFDEAILKAKKGDFSLYMQLALVASKDKVIAAIDYRDYEKKQYTELLRAVLQTGHSELTLLNLQHLTDRDFSNILDKSRELRVLHIPGCTNLSNSCMQIIADKCQDLRELDISCMSNWSDISLQSPFKNLRVLNLKDCSKLRRFEISAPNVRFFYADGCKQLTLCTLGSSRLVKVALSYCSSLPSKTLIRLLRPASCVLSILDIRECNALDHFGIRSKYLELNYAEYIPEKLAIALSSIDSEKINLAGCEFTEYHMLTLMKYIKAIDFTLLELNFSDCSFTLGAEQLLAEVVLSGKGVRRLILDRATFLHPIDKYINKILKDSFVLHGLSLSGLNIDDDGIHRMAPYLRNNYFIFDLDLSNNKIKDNGANELTQAIQENIGVLNLSDNDISTAGMKHLFAYLQSAHCSIISLDLHGNAKTKHDNFCILQEWVNVVKTNKSLTSCILITDDEVNEEATDSTIQLPQGGTRLSRRSSVMFPLKNNGVQTTSGSFFRSKQSAFSVNRPIKVGVQSADSINARFISDNQALCNQLTEAMSNGEIVVVKSLVEQGVSFLARNTYGRSALQEAVLTSQEEILEYFLSRNPNINIINIYGKTVAELVKTQTIDNKLQNHVNFRRKLQQDKNNNYAHNHQSPQYSMSMFSRATELSSEYVNAWLERTENPLFDLNDYDNRGLDPNAEYKFVADAKSVPYLCLY